MAAVCGPGGENVLYGWGKNAPSIHLPEKTGFAVGPGTGIRSVVLQVHYLQLRQSDDKSGVKLRLTPTPVPYSAGLIAFAAGFTVPPGQASHLVPNQCCYSGFEELRGFAFRVHTHKLGKSVYLEKSVPKDSLKGSYTAPVRVTAQDPQRPQGFYPVDPVVRIRPGDTFKSTCDFDSSLMTHPVSSGHSSAHEMCNLYLMLYGELPYFMWCVDSDAWIQVDGAGGMPPRGVAKEETVYWTPKHVIDDITLPPEDGGGAGRGGEKEKETAATTTTTTTTSTEDVKMIIGQVGGVASGLNSTVWAFHRGFRTWTASSFGADNKFTKGSIRWPAVLRLDRDNGSLLSAWGNDTFYMPHMITQTAEDEEGVGKEGTAPRPLLWVVDAGRHQAMKFSEEGKLLMTLGEELDPGNSTEPLRFCKPTHVVVARDGTIYVADGYCNARVVVVSGKGEFKEVWDLNRRRKEGAPPALPHSLALDECRRRLYIADREAGRILAFNMDAKEVQGYWDVGTKYGLPYAVHIGPYGAPMVLAWDRDASGKSRLVVLSTSIGEFTEVYELEGVNAPHDFTIVPAPLELTGPGERLVAVVVAETASKGSKLRKFVLTAEDNHLGKDGDEEEEDEEDAGKAVADAAGGQDQPAGLAASHAGHTMLKPVDSDGSDTKDKKKKEEKEVVVEEEEESLPSPSPSPSPDEKEEEGKDTKTESDEVTESEKQTEEEEENKGDDYSWDQTAMEKEKVAEEEEEDEEEEEEEEEKQQDRHQELVSVDINELRSKSNSKSSSKSEEPPPPSTMLSVIGRLVAGSPILVFVTLASTVVVAKIAQNRWQAYRLRVRGYRPADHLA